MTKSLLPLLVSSLVLSATPGMLRADTLVEVTADPASFRLSGPNALHSLLIHGKTSDGRAVDLTRSAEYHTSNPAVAQVADTGLVRPVSDGAAVVTVAVSGRKLQVPVTIDGAARPRQFNFENDIVPILSKFGCNSSGCHGKAEGQNGFKLSVFGFDPAADFTALAKESRGRRVFPAAPEQSLLLQKVSGQVAHGGGLRIPRRAAEYETLRAWIAAGMPFGKATDPKVESIRVEPRERLLDMRGKGFSQQQLRVIARYSDGRDADVTHHAKFQSNNDALASVDGAGLVSAGDVPGEAAIMAGFMGAVDVFHAVIPRAERIDPYPALQENNFIDKLVFQKLRKFHILPSQPADDAEYLRRLYLDVIGTLPTPEEARRFLQDSRSDKRARLLDELLDRSEFADYWALKWSDLLRVDRQALGHKRAYAYYKWIRDSLAANKPYDQFVRELLTAEGPLQEAPAAAFYKLFNKPGDTASTLSQVFLGVRIACAECHHHPFDRWGQTDYYGMQAFFTPLQVRTAPLGEEMMASGNPETRHPRTGEPIFAHALGVNMPEASPEGDRRGVLADWLTAADNPWFARNFANRVWAHFLGRGLVEPVDDVRATNPPTNPELLDALAKHVIETRFDFRQLIRTIAASRVYQLSAQPNATNERDEQNYSRAMLKRIDAEVLLDMVCQATGVPEKFDGMPAGYRAIQLWDSKTPHYFLKLFGRPVRVSACECERVQEANVSQVLHIMNSPEIHAKISHDAGTVARLLRRNTDDSPLADELYLAYFSRFPTAKEKEIAVQYLHKNAAKRQQAAEDLAWSLMNSLEFVFNH